MASNNSVHKSSNKTTHSFCAFLLVLASLSRCAAMTFQDTSETINKVRAVANAVLRGATFRFVDRQSGLRFKSPREAPSDAKIQLESPYNDWRYWNGVLNIAMIRLGEVLHESRYRDFAVRNIAFGFDNYRYFEKRYKGEEKWSYPFGQRFIMEELDDCGAMGASVIEVFRCDPQHRYREYTDQASAHILTRQARLPDGTLVRSFPQKWTLWADDLYMSISFLSRMGELTGEDKYYDDAAMQVINFQKHLFDKRMDLMHHCWYSDLQRPGVAFWGRANGWALLAQVDLLDRLPKNYAKRAQLLEILQQHILGVARYQGAEGLWHQLLDKTDSYLETSCSAMFTYVIARSVNKGYIEPRYASIALRGWEGVMTKIQADGRVEGVCTGTSVSDDLVYYYCRPAPLNDVHGIGAVLLAGSEILQLGK
ncbi:MAG: glycoside hydrolase family 88 protein [Ignavibacteriales bacterium]|nr:glycoside hydrolase family 88 protein [Ignavibacteriales bacterium]